MCPKRKPKTPKSPTNPNRASGSKEQCGIMPSIPWAMDSGIGHYSKNNELGAREEQKHKKWMREEMENECDDWDIVPPFSYIGISIWSSSACSTWLQVWNNHGGPKLVFVTGRGGAGFHSPDPALTWGREGYVSRNPRPAPVKGPPALIPWTGPRLLVRVFNGDPSGVWVGRWPERGQWQRMPNKTPRSRPLSVAGREKGRGPRFFGALSAP